MPDILPAFSGAILETKRNNPAHHLKEERKFRQLLKGGWRQCRPHMRRNDLQGLFCLLPVFLQNFVNGNGRKDVAKVAIVTFVLVIPLFLNEFVHPGDNFPLSGGVKLPIKNGVAAIHDHVKRLVDFLHFMAVTQSQCLDSLRWKTTFLNPTAVRRVSNSSGV